MATNCIICNKTLKFMNKPGLGQGKLKDGTEVCLKCMGRISIRKTLGPFGLRRWTLKDINDLGIDSHEQFQMMCEADAERAQKEKEQENER